MAGSNSVKKENGNIVLLLTGTINPNSHDILAVQDPEIRRRQYIDAIFYYLQNTDYNIIFTENSGTSIKNEFEGQERIEIITFSSLASVPDKGKGWKELEIIDYSITNSKFIHSGVAVVKITGRLKVLDINSIGEQVKRLKSGLDNFVLCNVYKAFKMDSRCFAFTLDFWPVLFKHGQYINLHYSFERALWKAICEYDLLSNCKYKQFNQPLRISGISGGLGIPYKHGFFLTMIKRVRHFFMVPLIYEKFRNQSI